VRTPIVLLTRIRFVEDLATFTATEPAIPKTAPSVGAVRLQLVSDTGKGCPPAVAVEVMYIKPFVIAWVFAPDDTTDELPDTNVAVPPIDTSDVGFVEAPETFAE